MDINTGIDQFDQEFTNAPGIEQFDQELKNTIVEKLENKWYLTLPAEIKKIDKEIKYLVHFEFDLIKKKDEYRSNNNDGSELPIYFDVFIDETNKKKDYLFDEKFKIWMEHLYDIKINNIFEKYKYDLYTTRPVPTNRIPYSWRIEPWT